MTRLARVLGFLILAGAVLGGRTAGAAGPADFYKGRQIDLVVAGNPGGSYDAYGRTVGAHIGKHIPGQPKIIVRSRPGAGGLRMANYMYNKAPKDGSVFGIHNRGVTFMPLMGIKNAKFDPLKVSWIGSVGKETSVVAVSDKVPHRSFKDILKTQLIVGGGSTAGDANMYAAVLNAVLGTKFMVISGYPGSAGVSLAIERGEVGGRVGWSYTSLKTSSYQKLKQGKLIILLQMAMEKDPELPNIPLANELVKDEDDRKVMELIFARQSISWPFLAPPGIPADRLRALRGAFMATMKDPVYLAAANKRFLDTRAPIGGEEMLAIIKKVYATPKPIVERARYIYHNRKIHYRKTNFKTVAASISKIKRKGRRVFFSDGGKKVMTRVSGRRTKVTISGKKVKRSKLKVGMSCKITYEGHKSVAKKIACK